MKADSEVAAAIEKDEAGRPLGEKLSKVERRRRQKRRRVHDAVLYGITIASLDTILFGLCVGTFSAWLLAGVLMSILWLILFYTANAGW